MKREGFYDKHAYQILLTFLPTMAGMLVLNDVCKLSISSIVLGILIILWVILIRILDYNKSILVFKITILLLSVLLVGVVIYNLEGIMELKDKVSLIASGTLKRDELGGAELLIFNLLLILLLSLPLYILQKYKSTRIILATGILGFLIFLSTREMMLQLYPITFSLIYIFLVLTEILVARYIPHRQINSSRVMLYLAPLMLLYLLMAAKMPVSEKPVDIHEKLVYGIKDTVTNWYHDIQYWLSPDNGEYGVNMLGYSEDANFGGIEEADDKVCLKVSCQNPMGQTLYLRGNWKNEYTGQNWKEEVEDTDVYDAHSEDSLDWNELLYAMYRYDGLKSLEDLMRIDNIEITYDDIETSSIFLPARTTNIRASMALDKMTPENINYRALMRKGNRYFLSTLKLNYHSKAWKDFVDKIQNYSYSEANTVDIEEYHKLVQDYGISIGLDSNFNNEGILAKRAAYIKKEFTNLPENLPERISELTKKITQNCKTPLEKCEAIEAYLKTYRYTLQPEKVPGDEDMVDYFLFQSREGYCSYFASAMAVMLRTIDIPSRYAQGFAIETGINPYSKYEAKSTNAHAWVEVYIEGLGWTTFDPTPSSETGLSMEYRWNDDDSVYVPESNVDIEGNKLKNEELQAYYEKLAREKQKAEENDSNNLELFNWLLLIVIGMIVIGLLLSISYVTIKITHNRKILRNMGLKDSLHAVMAQIFFLLEALNLSADDKETLHQYFIRIEESMKDNKHVLEELEEIYSSARYSRKAVSIEELNKFIQFRQMLLMKLRKERGIYGYWILWIKFSMRTIK